MTNETNVLEERLIARFSPPLAPDEVQRCLAEFVLGHDEARIRVHSQTHLVEPGGPP